MREKERRGSEGRLCGPSSEATSRPCSRPWPPTPSGTRLRECHYGGLYHGPDAAAHHVLGPLTEDIPTSRPRRGADRVRGHGAAEVRHHPERSVSGTTREECLDYCAGENHTAIVRELPGLTRWVQNQVVSAPAEPAACDGVGELSFESDEVMRAALNSPEMAAAVEDAQNFLDMEKTGLLIVEEKTVVA